MIESLQDKIYQSKNKQAKGAKLGASLRQEVKSEKCFKSLQIT